MTQIAYLVDHLSCLPELARLHHAEWSYLRPGESLQERTSRLRDCCGHNGIPTAVIALEAEELLGSAMLVPHDMTTRPDLTPWLAGVYVRRQHRGRGIGTTLIRRIESEADTLRTPVLYLYTENAESLYESLGWSTIDRCQYQGTNVAVMSKQLAAWRTPHSTPGGRDAALRRRP